MGRLVLPLLGLLLCWGKPALAASSGLIGELQGNFTQGGLVFGAVSKGTRVYWGERRVYTTPSGEFAVGLDRDAPPSVTLILVPSNGASSEVSFAVSEREYRIQKLTGISKKVMNPDAQDLERIKREAEQVRLARARRFESREFLSDFEWPLIGPITGVFGSQRVYNGVPKRPHYGVDVAAPVGTPVRAPAGGEVTLAQDGMFYSGGTLIIDHGYGLSSSFLHLSRILVEPGVYVEQGQLIAEVGATGRVTGAHLDWRMNWYDQRIDPQLLVGAMPSSTEQTKLDATGGTK